MLLWRPHSAAAVGVTILLINLCRSHSQTFIADGCSATASGYEALNGLFGNIVVKNGDSCTYRITTTASSSNLVLTANGLDEGNMDVWVCDTSDCDSRLVLDLADGTITQLLAMDYPDGLWLGMQVPQNASLPPRAALEFSTWTDTCAAPVSTPLLFTHTPFDSGLEPGPSYSLCVPKPDPNTNTGHTFFSWGWSLDALPASLVDGGFYAQVPPFPVTMRSDSYHVRFTVPTSPDGVLPMTIRLVLLDAADEMVAEFTDSVKSFHVTPSSNIARAIIEYYVPPGSDDLQIAAVEVVRNSSPPQGASGAGGGSGGGAIMAAPPPPPPPELDMCRPASSPLVVLTDKPPSFSIEVTVVAFARVLAGWDVDATTLQGGCAFSFPATTAAGDRVARHCLFFASAPSPYAAAFAWLGSSPAVGQVLLAPGSAAALPADLASDDLTVLLSGDGRTAPLLVDYMAELADCAEAGTVPFHLMPNSPRIASDVTLSICTPAPVVTSAGAAAPVLEFAFGWDDEALPWAFADPEGLRAELRNASLGAGMRLQPGWYRSTLLVDPAVTLLLQLGRTQVWRNSTFYLPVAAESISLWADLPTYTRRQAVRVVIKVAAWVFRPPHPPRPPPEPSSPPAVPSTPAVSPPPTTPESPSLDPIVPSQPASDTPGPPPSHPSELSPSSSRLPPTQLVTDFPSPPHSLLPPLSPDSPSPPPSPPPPLSPESPSSPPSPPSPLSPDSPSPPPSPPPPLSPDPPSPPSSPPPPLSPDSPCPPLPPPLPLTPPTIGAVPLVPLQPSLKAPSPSPPPPTLLAPAPTTSETSGPQGLSSPPPAIPPSIAPTYPSLDAPPAYGSPQSTPLAPAYSGYHSSIPPSPSTRIAAIRSPPLQKISGPDITIVGEGNNNSSSGSGSPAPARDQTLSPPPPLPPPPPPSVLKLAVEGGVAAPPLQISSATRVVVGVNGSVTLQLLVSLAAGVAILMVVLAA